MLAQRRRRCANIERQGEECGIKELEKQNKFMVLNPSTAKLFNFHPLEVVSRWRDPQLQVGENYSDLAKWRSTV